MRQVKMLLLASMVILFTACGGGSGGSSVADNGIPVVKFIDDQYGMYLYDKKVELTLDENGNRLTKTTTFGGILDNWLSNVKTTPRYYSPIVYDKAISYTYNFANNEVIITDHKNKYLETFKFDNTGKILSADGNNSNTSYAYYADNTIKNVISEYSYNYDSGNGYKVSINTTYSQYGRVEIQTVDYDYNESYLDNISEDIYFADSETMYTYNNNIVALQETTRKYKSGNVVNWTYVYDNEVDGRATSVYIDDNDEGTYELHYQYYDNGVVSQHTYREDTTKGTWYECLYEFEQDGNLTNETCSSS